MLIQQILAKAVKDAQAVDVTALLALVDVHIRDLPLGVDFVAIERCSVASLVACSESLTLDSV